MPPLMGAAPLLSEPLLDAVSAAQSFVAVFIWVYTILILVLVLSSWVKLPYSFNPVLRFLHDVGDPYLGFFRRFVPPLGAFDLSPMVAVIALYALQRIVNDVILARLH